MYGSPSVKALQISMPKRKEKERKVFNIESIWALRQGIKKNTRKIDGEKGTLVKDLLKYCMT